ncbi:MAG: SU10 major capsid protein, partial [Bacteroidales bacterium]
NVKGNIGTQNLAGKFAGFEGLVAPLHVPDPDTGAVTHLESFYFDEKGPWVTNKDVFGLTYQLYMAGSKANKIMYHPRHALAFSKFISDNQEHTHRMFDGLSATFNTFVDRIKCPLGRNYDLIPNRHMPEDKIFFFNEDDWTQTVLRTPVVTPLGKQGSAERYLIEMEVGLRCRHPYASGILTLVEENLRLTFPTFENNLIFGIKNTGQINLVAKDLSQTPLPNKNVVVTSLTPDIISFAPNSGVTDGNGLFGCTVTGLKIGRGEFTITVDGMLSRKYYVAVGEPEFFANMSPDTVGINKRANFQVFVNDEQGAPAGAGIPVSWSAFPTNLLEFTSISGVTDASGIAETTVTGRSKGAGTITPVVGGHRGESIPFYVGINGEMSISANPNPAQVGDEITISGRMFDQRGEFLADDTISFVSDPVGLNFPSDTTSATGTFESKLTPVVNGDYDITATSSDFGVSKTFTLVIELNR